MNHSPTPVCDDLSDTNALVLEGSRKFVLILVCDRNQRHRFRLRYSTGWGSGLVTGGVLFGDLRGGGGVTGSAVGDTGSSSGMIVYLLTGCPICATADPPYADCQCRHSTPKRSPLHRHSTLHRHSQVAPTKRYRPLLGIMFLGEIRVFIAAFASPPDRATRSPSAATRTGRGRCLDSHCFHRRVGIDICGGRLGTGRFRCPG